MFSRVSHAILKIGMCLNFKRITTVALITAITHFGGAWLQSFGSAKVSGRTATADGFR
jgi:hypothetical protein